jgi:atypical dual specificity phosphatase
MWWTRIDSQLILGGIPLHNLSHLEALKKENVGAIVSILEPFELVPTLHFNPISKEEWESNDITVLQLSVEDTYGVQREDISRAIDFLIEQQKHGKTVYIHCKAGKGRSASIVLCYLLYQYYQQYKNITEEDIMRTYSMLTQIRDEVNISDTQFIPIYKYIIYLKDKNPLS